jgi:hypothetical protein
MRVPTLPRQTSPYLLLQVIKMLNHGWFEGHDKGINDNTSLGVGVGGSEAEPMQSFLPKLGGHHGWLPLGRREKTLEMACCEEY